MIIMLNYVVGHGRRHFPSRCQTFYWTVLDNKTGTSRRCHLTKGDWVKDTFVFTKKAYLGKWSATCLEDVAFWFVFSNSSQGFLLSMDTAMKMDLNKLTLFFTVCLMTIINKTSTKLARWNFNSLKANKDLPDCGIGQNIFIS